MHHQPHEELAARRGLGLPDGVGARKANVGGEEQTVGTSSGERAVHRVSPNHGIWNIRLELDRADDVTKAQVLPQGHQGDTASDVAHPTVASESLGHSDRGFADKGDKLREFPGDRYAFREPVIEPEFDTFTIANPN
jgi:hypothetical protein